MRRLRNRLVVPTAVTLFSLNPMTSAPPVVAAANSPAPPFTECPALGLDTSCGILIVINPDGSTSVLSDSAQRPYDGADDTLIGVLNNSSLTVKIVTLSSTSSPSIFAFDGDGLCTTSNRPLGCPFGPTGYEGPGTSLNRIDPTDPNDGEVTFAGGGLDSGQS